MNRNIVCIWLFLISAFGSAQVIGQTSQEQLKHFATANKMSASVLKFYELRQYRTAWINHPEATAQLAGLLSAAPDYGLDTADYYFSYIRTFMEHKLSGKTKNDSLLFEVRVTEAAIQFMEDLAYGNKPPSIGYNGLEYAPACHDIPVLLSSAGDSRSLQRAVDAIQPASPDYIAVKSLMNQWQQMVATPSFRDEPVTSASVSIANTQLLKRLWQLGLLDSIPKSMTTASIKSLVQQAQQLFNLQHDGYIRQSLLKEINVSLKWRIKELKLALNAIRWLNCAKTAGPAIVVNIPSANLLVYENNKVVLESKIIVGKRSTRTPTLTGKVNEVILYPYWIVPNSIATKELLPLIKKNPGYLAMNGMQVLNNQGRVVSPASVNWSELSASNFPYVIRQSTGCDNSLGLVKLNFYNPYHVYLHDTPWKVLFAANKRYFSHGCMRVEKAMELAHLLLKGNTIAVDTLEEKGCLRNQAPISVPASISMPVFVLYNTAWIDAAATVRFNEDVYRRLSN